MQILVDNKGYFAVSLRLGADAVACTGLGYVPDKTLKLLCLLGIGHC